MSNWKSASHSKYLLQYHLIFVCKYRKKLLVSQQIAYNVKVFSTEICEKHEVSIKYMETDKDHIHYMIETRPNINLSDFVRTMKSYITYHIWEKYSAYLHKCFLERKDILYRWVFYLFSWQCKRKDTKRIYKKNQG